MANQASTQNPVTAPLPTSVTHAPVAGEAPVPAPPSSSPPWILRRQVRFAIYSLLILFFLWMIGWRYVPALLDPTFEKHIQEKKVIVGMTKQQALQAWGSPYTIHVTHTKDGIRREEWIYEDWKSASEIQHRYLYFEEGILVGGWYHQ